PFQKPYIHGITIDDAFQMEGRFLSLSSFYGSGPHRSFWVLFQNLSKCCVLSASTSGGRFPRARPRPPPSHDSLLAGSRDTCLSRRSRRLTFQRIRVSCFEEIVLGSSRAFL